MTTTTYSGSCHCGAVRFEVDAALRRAGAAAIDGDDVVVVCNCSICSKKGFLHLMVPPERFRLLTSPAALSTYTFGTHTAKHTFCARCGMHPFYTPRSHPNHVDVNVRCLDGIELESLALSPFDGRQWEDNIEALRREVP
jgi:hypothetical protein